MLQVFVLLFVMQDPCIFLKIYNRRFDRQNKNTYVETIVTCVLQPISREYSKHIVHLVVSNCVWLHATDYNTYNKYYQKSTLEFKSSIFYLNKINIISIGLAFVWLHKHIGYIMFIWQISIHINFVFEHVLTVDTNVFSTFKKIC